VTTDIILNRVPQQFLVFISVPRDSGRCLPVIPRSDNQVIPYVGGEGVDLRQVGKRANNNPALVKMPNGGCGGLLCVVDIEWCVG